MSVSFQQLANFIWSAADLLRGPYRPPQYERVMLLLTVLRRFDAILNNRALDEDGKPLGFHSHSQLDFRRLKGDPDNWSSGCAATARGADLSGATQRGDVRTAGRRAGGPRRARYPAGRYPAALSPQPAPAAR